MSHLQACSACGGLNPTNAQTSPVCLHCDRPLAPRRPSMIKHALTVTGTLAMSMTLSACYGMPIDDYSCMVDEDRDGYCAPDSSLAFDERSGADCDDNDPSIGNYYTFETGACPGFEADMMIALPEAGATPQAGTTPEAGAPPQAGMTAGMSAGTGG